MPTEITIDVPVYPPSMSQLSARTAALDAAIRWAEIAATPGTHSTDGLESLALRWERYLMTGVFSDE
jgi:hypothetical protein